MRDRGINAHLAKCLNSVLNVKAVVAAFNQEKALVGAFSVITNLRMELFEALEQEEAGEEKSDKFVKKDEGRERQIREPRIETPTHTGGVSEEARRREEARGRGDRGLRVENRRDRDSGYYDREWRRDPVREDRHRK